MNTLTTNTRANMQKKNRLSVKNIGVGLAGLGAVNQRIPVAMSTNMLLIQAVKELGAVKIVTTGKALEGEVVETGKASSWGEKMNKFGALLKPNVPSYFVLFRKTTDCLICTYVPDTAKPQIKMLYASNKESVKDALMDLDPNMDLEEYNVAEIEDLTYERYQSKTALPKPYTEAEILKKEQEAAETGGSYGILARMKALGDGRPMSTKHVLSGAAGAKPMALPGLSGGGFNPKDLRASLKPIGKTKVPLNKMPKGQSKFVSAPKPAGKAVFTAVGSDEKHFKKVMETFGVNDRENRVRKEFDLIMEGMDNDRKTENVPQALKPKKSLEPVEIDDDVLGILAPSKAKTQQVAAAPVQQQEPVEVKQATEPIKQQPPKKPKKPGFFSRIFGIFRKKKNPNRASANIEELV